MDGDPGKPAKRKGFHKRPTLKTVAEATGFAVTTVSRALANDPRIAQSTRDKVAKAAKKLGYVPDRAAQRLRTGRTKVISLLINPHHEFLGFTDVLLSGLTESLRETGYHINITPDYIEGDRVSTVENIMRNNLADGIVCSRTERHDKRVQLMLESDFPFVTHGRTEFETPHPFVDFDNESFARHAVSRLSEKGRRRLCMIAPDPRFTFSQHLRVGFLSAAKKSGVEAIIPEDITLDVSAEALCGWLKRNRLMDHPPDGYICVGEVMALATMAALKDTGASVGDDVDVIAKRASPIFGLMRPKVESVFEDLRATGLAIGEMLIRRIEGERSDRLQRLIPPLEGF